MGDGQGDGDGDAEFRAGEHARPWYGTAHPGEPTLFTQNDTLVYRLSTIALEGKGVVLSACISRGGGDVLQKDV